MRLRRGARVLDRGDGTLQIGTRPGLVLKGLSQTQRTFVERLETTVSLSARQQQRHGDLLTALATADLLEPPDAPVHTLGITDAGPIGLAIGIGAARDGWSVRFVDDGGLQFAPPGTYSTGVIASARQGAACITVRSHVPMAKVSAGDGPADAWVIVSQGAPGLDAAVSMMARDTPHLFVAVDERGARVGPFVEPGESACGWCDGLAHADADAAWPRLALQLSAPSPAVRITSADVVAGATSLVLGACVAWRDGRPELWRNKAWLLTSGEPMAQEEVRPHPQCGCAAAGDVGDDLAARRSRLHADARPIDE